MRTFYLSLFGATTFYAAVLQTFKRHIEPDWTWLEVVIGTAIVLFFARLIRRSRPDLSPEQVEQHIWLCFVVGGTPIILWQIWQRLSDMKDAIEEAIG